MTRQPAIARRAEELLEHSVVATSPVAGGDICTATRLRLSDGGVALMKTLPHPPEDFFAAEARGLRWLGEVGGERGGVDVPEVLGVAPDCLIIRWVEPAKPTAEAAGTLGRRLAVTHAAGAPAYGAGQDGFIGKLPLPNRTAPTWAEFYATRRVLPYLKLGRDRGTITEAESATIEAIIGRLPDLVPEEGPARLHGDLWNGNVLWGAEGGSAVIDPAAHGGHRETDLAMLSLFGLANLPKVFTGYAEAAAELGRPLAEGWEDRAAIHQLFPLLVHACMFGGGYGARAAASISDL